MNQQGAMGFLAGMLICVAIFLAIWLCVYILFLLNLHWTLAEVDERNREMSPGLVWLLLVPIFNIVWAIILVARVANSLRNEFRDRGWRTRDEGFARTVGMLWAWGGVVNVGLSIVQNVAQFAKMEPIAMVVSLIGCPLAIGIFVCWIIFWVQTYQYRKRLTEGQRGYRDGSIEDDYDDRRRPRYDEDDDYDDRDDDRPRRRDRDD